MPYVKISLLSGAPLLLSEASSTVSFSSVLNVERKSVEESMSEASLGPKSQMSKRLVCSALAVKRHLNVAQVISIQFWFVVPVSFLPIAYIIRSFDKPLLEIRVSLR